MDGHFTNFFNNPPHLMATELKFDLPVDEKAIDIWDATKWKLWANKEMKHQRPPPLNQFIQDLLSDNWPGFDDPCYENLSIFALFLAISAFHPIVFSVRSSLCHMPDVVRQIERALVRWMTLWERLQARLNQDQIYRAGILIHAQDLCIFAKLLLRTPLSETGEISRDSMARVYELLRNAPK
ncbi:hypothetical protein N7495_000751 [Penicillium taxi]|uniref:uncharacterized protein n=1 Tax=Penicillium taxi TaxID=168475 RepID=UPI002545194A|nr:uncharacterized protein N7495_000751 [Penicillium taxi]KAJ5908069.1 hypothetical protein N7495_000751 [Penicillium taxi]